MYPLRHIDFRISREMFEAFSRFILQKFQLVHQALENREAEVDSFDIMLYDHVLSKITPTHVGSWRYKKYDKMYNYKLPIGVALVIHEVLTSEGYANSFKLEQFHNNLYMALSRYISDSVLNPPERVIHVSKA